MRSTVLRGLVAAALSVPAVLVASPATAGTCHTPDWVEYYCPDPAIVSVYGPPTVVQTTTSPVTVPVTVTVHDPSDIMDAVEVTLRHGATQVDWDYASQPTAVSGDTLTYRLNLTHYDWEPYGAMDIDVELISWQADVPDTASRAVAIKARTAATNTPSATSVRRGQQFTERGVLRRFDGSPVVGETVNVYYVPAGQTRASFAGTAVTSATGSWSRAVRAYYTGSWFVSYPGSATNQSTYKGAWVTVR